MSSRVSLRNQESIHSDDSTLHHFLTSFLYSGKYREITVISNDAMIDVFGSLSNKNWNENSNRDSFETRPPVRL